MMNRIFYILVTTVVLFSCRQDTKKLLTGKWHAVKFENNLQMLTGKWNAISMSNPEMDSFFINGQNYIDTVGKHNDAATNKRLYGVTNMDSMRIILQKQFDSAKQMQTGAVTTTSFTFNEDGVAILIFHGVVDSSMWYVDSLGSLILDDMNENTRGDKVKMEIVSVSDKELKLKFRENNAYSTVTFHPDAVKEVKTDPPVETFFNFRKDGIAELTFDQQTDSARWQLASDSVIAISSTVNNPEATEMKWSILKLDGNNLALRIVESSSISTLTFKRDTK